MYTFHDIKRSGCTISIRGSHWDGIDRRDYIDIKVGSADVARDVAQKLLTAADEAQRHQEQQDGEHLTSLRKKRRELDAEIKRYEAKRKGER